MARGKIENGRMVIELELPESGLFDVATAALYCDVGRGKIRNAVREEELAYSMVGPDEGRKVTRISQEDLDAWLIAYLPGERRKGGKAEKLPSRAKQLKRVRGYVEQSTEVDPQRKAVVIEVLNELLSVVIADWHAAKAEEVEEEEE